MLGVSDSIAERSLMMNSGMSGSRVLFNACLNHCTSTATTATIIQPRSLTHSLPSPSPTPGIGVRVSQNASRRISQLPTKKN